MPSIDTLSCFAGFPGELNQINQVYVDREVVCGLHISIWSWCQYAVHSLCSNWCTIMIGVGQVSPSLEWTCNKSSQSGVRWDLHQVIDRAHFHITRLTLRVDSFARNITENKNILSCSCLHLSIGPCSTNCFASQKEHRLSCRTPPRCPMIFKRWDQLQQANAAVLPLIWWFLASVPSWARW